MHDKVENRPSGRHAFRRGLLRENPVLMQFIGLFPAVALAASVKSAVIVALAAAFILIVMELLTTLLLKRLPFWLRIGLYVLLSYGILAGGMTICDRFFPNLLGPLSSYLPLLAVNSLTVYRCETCAVQSRLRISLLDAVGASLGYGAVVLLLGLFRELLGAGAIWGYPVFAGPWATGLLMPFGGFLMLGFLAAAVKWLYNRRHQGEEELETPVAHVDEEEGSVMEPLLRFIQKGRSVQAAHAQHTGDQKQGSQPKAHGGSGRKMKAENRQMPERKQLGKKKAEASEQATAPQQRPAKPAMKQKALDGKRLPTAHRKPESSEPEQMPGSAAGSQPAKRAEKRSEKKAGRPLQADKTARQARTHMPPDPIRIQQEEELESFAEVLAALNRRREEEKKAAGKSEQKEQKGED